MVASIVEIAVANARVCDDPRHMGAPNDYLLQTVQGQFFGFPGGDNGDRCLLWNDPLLQCNQFTPGKRADIGTCIAVMAVLSAVLYGVYRLTRRMVCRTL